MWGGGSECQIHQKKGMYVNSKGCVDHNWTKKEEIIKDEIDKWKLFNLSFKTRINIILERMKVLIIMFYHVFFHLLINGS